MLYNVDIFFNDLDDENNKILSTFMQLEKQGVNKSIVDRIKSDYRYYVVIRACGQFEVLFSSIIEEFSKRHLSPLFHKAFVGYFISRGKNIEPDKVNSILKILGVTTINRNDCPQVYDSLVSLYNIRTNIAHGNDMNFEETLECIIDYIKNIRVFFKTLEDNLDSVQVSRDKEYEKSK